jgi:pimeloyl-ACP methyl ester carboxylesterase
MRLHTREWGSGDRVALLVHGMMGESRQFWEVGPALAARGFRAIAVDLPGHGHSGQCRAGGLGAYADSLVESVPQQPTLAIGQSLGGLVVAAALERLGPERAVYVDIPFEPLESDEQPQDAAVLTVMFEQAKAGRTAARLARTRPWWKERDCEVEEEAARLFDVPTAVALELSESWDDITAPATDIPSLVIHADPSEYVSERRVGELARLGFDVRGVRGAGHSVWYGYFDDYMAVLDDWLATRLAS